jgi:hypothetical protein
VSRVVVAASFACGAERLARVSTAYNVRSNNVSPIDSFDVSIVGHLGPVFREHPARVGVDFRLPDDFHAGAFEAEV